MFVKKKKIQIRFSLGEFNIDSEANGGQELLGKTPGSCGNIGIHVNNLLR